MIDWTRLFDNDFVRGGLITAAGALVGIISHQVVTTAVQGRQIALHEERIHELSSVQTSIQKDVQQTNITVTRIEGKLDVVGQKIDDDRRELNRGH